MINLHWSQCDFAVVDVEGNGHSPQEIIELAIVPIKEGRIAESWHEWLIRPTKSVTRYASNVHGIFDSDLVAKPAFAELSAEILPILGQQAVIGHNVAVDVQLLKLQLPSWNPVVAIDTLRLAKWAIPGADGYSLEALLNNLRIGVPAIARTAHRAASDALAAAELFLALAKILDKGDLNLRTLAEMSASAKDPFFKTTQQSLF